MRNDSCRKNCDNCDRDRNGDEVHSGVYCKGGCVISLWRTLFYVIIAPILEVSLFKQESYYIVCKFYFFRSSLL